MRRGLFILSLVASCADVTPFGGESESTRGPDFLVLPDADRTQQPDARAALATLDPDAARLDEAGRSGTSVLALVNRPPVASPGDYTLAEDTPTPFRLAGSDPDGTVVSVRVTKYPTHGVITGGPPNLTYTPEANWNGSDGLEFVASSNGDDSVPATIRFVVTSMPDAPVATSTYTNVPMNEAIDVVLPGSDPDGDALTWTVTAPDSGTLTGTAPNLRYTPPTGFVGTRRIEFSVRDASTTASATVSLAYVANNRRPVTRPEALSGNEEANIDWLMSGSDPDGAPVTFRITRPPANGTANFNLGLLTYRGRVDFNGVDTLEFVVNDGVLDSLPSTVTVTVLPVNDRPVVRTAVVTLTEDSSADVTLEATDPDGDAVTYRIDPPDARVTLVGAVATIRPAPDATDPFDFSWYAHDGRTLSTSARVFVTVTAVNDAPRFVPRALAVNEDEPSRLDLGVVDPDSVALTLSIPIPPSHGRLTGSLGTLLFTPDENFFGDDTFVAQVSDGELTSPATTLTVTVRSVNDRPRAEPRSLNAPEDTPVPLVLTARDVDSADLTYSISSAPRHGRVDGTPPDVTYVPAQDFFGRDFFSFVATDGIEPSPPADVVIEVAAVNDAPVALAQEVESDQRPVTIRVAATDPDPADTLAYALGEPPADGTLTGTPPTLTFTPAANFRGETAFSFTASDGRLTSAPAVVRLVVANSPPVVDLQASSLSFDEGEEITLTAAASDPGGDTLTYAWDLGDGATSTEPVVSKRFSSNTRVAVTVSDGDATATDAVDLQARNLAPVLGAPLLPEVIDEGTEVELSVDVSDPGGDPVVVRWQFGDGSPGVEGARVTHAFKDDGRLTLTVSATDDEDGFTSRSTAIEVRNRAPVIEESDLAITYIPGEPLTARIRATDPAGEADPLTFQRLDGPGTMLPTGLYAWTPPEGSNAVFKVKFEVRDDEGEFDVGTIVLSPPAGSCGCGPGAATMPWAALGALLLRRRRIAA